MEGQWRAASGVFWPETDSTCSQLHVGSGFWENRIRVADVARRQSTAGYSGDSRISLGVPQGKVSRSPKNILFFEF